MQAPTVYRLLDQLSGILLCFSLVFAPWAFGTTHPRSIGTMNGLGMALGVLLAGKVAIRMLRRPEFPPTAGRGSWVVKVAAVLTVLVLVWCLTSALNASAHYDPETQSLVYADRYISWLPHSYDAPSTWVFFWKAVALACYFWAARDSMLWDSGASRIESEWGGADYGEVVAGPLTRRGRSLLWLLGINGALLAVVGILQRLDGSSALLWLYHPPAPAPPADILFGPFAYRGNAAQYLNLVWPVCLGFGLLLHQGRVNTGTARLGTSPVGLLVFGALMMAAATVRMGTRAGGAVALGLLLVSTLYAVLWVGRIHGVRLAVVFAIPVLGIVLALGLTSGSLTLQRFLRPAYAYATGLDQPLSDYSLRCVFTVPPTNLVKTAGLVGIGPDDTFAYSPGSAFLSFTPGRKATFKVRNAEGDQIRPMNDLNLAEHPGEVVDLVLTCRDGEVQAYLDGRPTGEPQPLAKVGKPKENQDSDLGTGAAQRPQSQRADFLWAGSLAHVRGPGLQWVIRAELYDRALAPADVEELNRAFERKQGMELQPKPVLAVTAEDLRRPGLLNLYSSGRVEINRASHRMLKEYGLMGSGPGTYETLYPLHATGPVNLPFTPAHNDWMEFRITFGLPGFILLLGLLACIPLGLMQPGAGNLFQPLPFLGGVALLGCLAHAWVDYPFQVISVAHLFVLLACVLTTTLASKYSGHSLAERLQASDE